MKRSYLAWAAVLLFPILLNSAELLNFFKADPVLRYSYLQSSAIPGPVNIHASFDPSIGTVFQPLGDAQRTNCLMAGYRGGTRIRESALH